MSQARSGVINIIKEQTQEIDERCKGYRDEIFNTIADILSYEYEHRISRGNIQQKIDDKCDAVAGFLYSAKETDSGKDSE